MTRAPMGARLWLAATTLLVAVCARGQELDRSRYAEVPGLTHPTISTLAVNPDEPGISAVTRQLYAGRRPSGDYTLFYNTNGTVDGVDVDRSIPGCDDFVLGKLRKAQMMPHARVPIRRHMTIELSFHSREQPAAPPPGVRAKNVPPQVFDEQKISGDMPHLPDAVKARRRSSADLVWMGKVCVQADGSVNQVSTVTGIPGADEAIAAGLRTWRLRPQPLPICTMIRLVYAIAPPQPQQRR